MQGQAGGEDADGARLAQLLPGPDHTLRLQQGRQLRLQYVTDQLPSRGRKMHAIAGRVHDGALKWRHSHRRWPLPLRSLHL